MDYGGVAEEGSMLNSGRGGRPTCILYMIRVQRINQTSQPF